MSSPRRFVPSLLVAALLLLASCSGSPTEESAIEAVKELEGGSFMDSGSIDRYGIEKAVVEEECAAVRIIELPDLYEITVFLRWTEGHWEGTSIVTDHSVNINQAAADCFRD